MSLSSKFRLLAGSSLTAAALAGSFSLSLRIAGALPAGGTLAGAFGQPGILPADYADFATQAQGAAAALAVLAAAWACACVVLRTPEDASLPRLALSGVRALLQALLLPICIGGASGMHKAAFPILDASAPNAYAFAALALLSFGFAFSHAFGKILDGALLLLGRLGARILAALPDPRAR